MEGEDLAITVLTCEGDIKDPTFPFKLQRLVAKLQNLISDEDNPIKVTKVEPWNSVRVTFNIPLEAAQRLRQLAERGDRVLRELGILSVQVEGDQVITLTLASQYSEPQEIVLRKTSDEQGDVASVSFNLPNPDSVPGPSTAEPAHKNITQFLGHIVGGATASTSNANPPARLEKSVSPKTDNLLNFRSPNVIAPTSGEPIPFPPSTVITTTASLPSSSRVSPNVSLKSPGFGPFPFASMTHAMNTKISTSPQYQPGLHVQGGNPRLLSPSSHLTNAILSSASGSSATASTSKTSNAALQKVSRTITNSAFSSVVSRTVVSPNAIASTSRANVALSSPLLVNLLQSETSNSQQNNKLMPPPSQASNEAPKKKRKPRKMKEKGSDSALSPNFSASPSPPYSHAGARSPGSFDPMGVLGPSLNVPMSAVSPPSPQIANIHPMAQGQPQVSNLKSQTQTIHPPPQGLPPVSLPSSQVQGQPMVSTTRPLGHQTISAFRQTQGHRAVPNIHPQAQGQPQVHTGNLPLHTHIPVGPLQVSRPSVGSSQSYAMSAPRTIPTNPTRSLFGSREQSSIKSLDKTKESSTIKSDRTSAPSTPSTSTPDSNPFPSPPSSSDGKTKHLINPFTGQLEPMPSDEEEEEESIGSLPPFPEFENDTSEKSQSERSLSDGGKDNNLSSDTDSGISKSITDVSQSSTECLTADPGKELKKSDSVPTASVTSSVPGEKIKLRLKIDSKSIRESKEMEKRGKDSTLNQKIDVSVVSIPGMKKNVMSSMTSVPEPRVPPLHISLRGPNAAVVVSPRKDDSKSRHSSNKEDHSVGDVTTKGVPKKVRSPRAARTGESSTIALSLSGRTIESVDKRMKTSNPKDFRKTKDELWNPSMKMAMSGGGIVEVSEKLSSSRVPSYDSYLTSSTIGSTIVQHKSSNIFSLASRESCKPEVMTLTSCSTGESVTLHSFVEKSPLPLPVAAASETEIVEPSLIVKSEVSSNVSSLVLPTERRVPESNSDLDNIVSCEDSEMLSSSENAPVLQNKNNLPQSPSASLDSKNNVQNSSSSLSSNQTLSQQSASSLNNVDSTVPLSSTSSVSSPVCTHTVETASGVNGQEVQAGGNTDAKTILDQPCSGVAIPAEDVISLIDNHKLKISQCNTTTSHSSTHNSPETVEDSVNIVKNVQIGLISSPVAETLSTDNVVADVVEVQKTIVNKIDTANKESTEATLSTDNNSANSEISQHSLTPKQSAVEDGDKFKDFSNVSDTMCNLAVSCSTLVPKTTEISQVVASDENVCSVDVKDSSSPTAQIITTIANSPSQSHVIEVPSMQNLQPALSKSEQSVEVNSKSSLSPTRVSECDFSANDLAAKENPVTEGSSTSASATLPSNDLDKLSNHVNKTMPSNVKENVNIYVREELKMDPVEEDRKRCMLLSEIPTSTPGPPPLLSDCNVPKQDDQCSELPKSINVIQSIEDVDSNTTQKIETSNKEIKATTSDEVKPTIVSPKENEAQPDSTGSPDIHIQLHPVNKVPLKKEADSSERRVPSMSATNFPQSVNVTLTQNMPNPAPSLLFSTLASAPSANSIDAGTSLETRLTPKAEVIKKEVPSEPVHIVSSSANTLVTSLLSPVKYLNNEVSSQKFKLIFKGSSQRTSLPGGNASGSLVVPLNSSKVPIKLVALQGGASALSVRSTSNPNIVEIIGPKTAQNSVSNSSHISSPVRFVVSKMSPGMTCTTSGNSSNMRNRVVVKSVVVTSTSSPSIKLLPANSLSTTSLSSNSGATSTSTIIQSIPSPAISNSIVVENASALPDNSKLVASAETIQSSINSQGKINNESNNSVIDSTIKSVPVTASCSSSADSTTNDLCLNTTDPQSSESNSKAADSSVKLTVSPDSTSVCVTSTVETVTSSCKHSKSENVSETETVVLVSNSKLSNNEKCDKETVGKSAADTTSESIESKISSIKVESVDKFDTPSSSETLESSNSRILTDSDYKSIDTQPETKDNSSAVSNDSKSVEQTANSAIITSSKYISNDLEPPDTADSSVDIPTQHLLLDSSLKDSKLKQDTTHLVNSDSADNHVVSVPSKKLSDTDKTEVMVSNNANIDILFENDKGTSNSLSENSVDSAPSIVDKEEVIETVDADSLDTTSSVTMQKFRPLGDEESVSLADSTEMEDAKVVVEDSQLEISLVYSKPLKRKCSENAAELIKACMGVEDGPKRGVILKPKAPEDVIEEKGEVNDKVEENVRMSLRIRREEPLQPLPKKAKGPTLNSDCSTDEEIAISELATKSRTRDRPTRGRNSNRDSPVETNHCRPKRRRSGSNESRNSHSEEIKIITPREGKRGTVKKEEPPKKLPERTKRGTYKVAQDQVVVSKLGLQRSSRIREQEVKANNIKEESNSLGAKRKTRNTSESQEVLVAVKRRRYSKDGHR